MQSNILPVPGQVSETKYKFFRNMSAEYPTVLLGFKCSNSWSLKMYNHSNFMEDYIKFEKGSGIQIL